MSTGRPTQSPSKPGAAAGAAHTERGACPAVVVGIGVSDAGFESLRQLFASMPAGHQVAFVVIQHPGGPEEDRIAERLKDQTAFTVVEAEDGMPVLADRIHVMPRDRFLNISGARLTLHEPIYCNGLHMPVDHFFCSLGADQKGRGCGVLLSDTGSDGMLGLSEIKSAGGRTLVEASAANEPAEALRRVMDADVADAVLPASAMAEAIVTLADRVIAETRGQPAESPEFDADLRSILNIVRAHAGHDFRCYKPSTLVRRIRRRMALGKIESYRDYVQVLLNRPEELATLQKDLLIGVTEFFRQPNAWKVLEEKVVALTVEQARPQSQIRIWVPGCSTGEEAYSLAIMFAEQIEKLGKQAEFQIFATDPDASSLAVARTGSYPGEAVEARISAGRRKRFFVFQDGRYQVVKELRNRIVFAPQNLTADPPFSKLDLVSCRNLLIYLEQSVQQKIIALFHFALRDGGFLFLGTAETVGEREDLFQAVSKKWRIYRRIGVGRRVSVEIPVSPSRESSLASGRVPPLMSARRMSLAAMAQQVLVDRFAPACVMIDRKLQVVYVHGAVDQYLTFPSGELSTEVVAMAREGLRTRLRGAIAKCLETGRPVSVTARVNRGGRSVPVKAGVSTLPYPAEADGLFLITFEDYRVSAVRSKRQTSGDSDLRQLEDELKITREELQSTIEQLENANDQLKAYNEEVTAANEELQSANEELETSKEELQSLNEELNTINTRLQEKVDELETVNNDILNLLSSTSIATLFLDRELKVKRYTPAITQLLSLIPSDVGRPVADVLRRFNDDGWLEDARRVLAELTSLSKEVKANDGKWYIRRITPYRTQDDRIEGVVITFVDVSDLKQTEYALREAKDEWEQTFNTVPDLIALLDEQHRILRVNRAMATRLGVTPEQCVGLKCHEAIHGTSQPPGSCPHSRTCGDGLAHVAEVHEPRLGGDFIVSTNPRFDELGRFVGSVHVARDITERKRAEEEISRRAAELEGIFSAQTDAVLIYDTDMNVKRVTPSFLTIYGFDPVGLNVKEIVRRVSCRRLDGQELVWEEQPTSRALRGERVAGACFVVTRADGTEAVVETCSGPVRTGERISGTVTVWHDITELKQAEEAVRDSEARFRLLSQTASRLLASDEPQSIVNELCRGVMAYLDCQAFFNFLVDRSAGRLRLNAFSGIPDEEALKIEWLDYGVAVCGCVAQEECAMVAETILSSSDPRTELVKSFGIRAYACHPLRAQGRLIGTLSFGTKTRDHFSDHDLALMRTVTDQVATAMERMELIGELQRSHAELEQRVEERTVELIKANEALSQSNRDLEDFAHVASHDLQEPLRKIQTFANRLMSLQQMTWDEQTRDYFERMQRAAERMQALVQDLLQYSRVSSKPEALSRFSLRDAVNEVVTDLRVLREETGGRVEVEELPEIEADRVQMRQLFQNLIGNALKYHSERSPMIRVYSNPPSKESSVEIVVEDNGMGFDESFLEKIFKPFQRLHGRSSPIHGTGMGLAICRRIVERHGGTITAMSKSGEGSRFVVRLPVKPLAEEEKH